MVAEKSNITSIFEPSTLEESDQLEIVPTPGKKSPVKKREDLVLGLNLKVKCARSGTLSLSDFRESQCVTELASLRKGAKKVQKKNAITKAAGKEENKKSSEEPGLVAETGSHGEAAKNVEKKQPVKR